MDIRIVKLSLYEKLEYIGKDHLSQIMGFTDISSFNEKLNVILESDFLGLEEILHHFNGPISVFLQSLLQHLEVDQPEILQMLEVTYEKLYLNDFKRPHIRATWNCEDVLESEQLHGWKRMELLSRLRIYIPLNIIDDSSALAYWLGEIIPEHLYSISREFGGHGHIDGYLFCQSATEQNEIDFMGRVIGNNRDKKQ